MKPSRLVLWTSFFAVLSACNNINNSNFTSESTNGSADLAYFAAQGLEMREPMSDATGVTAQSLPSSSQLTFRGLKVAHCLTYIYTYPNQPETKFDRCAFIEAIPEDQCLTPGELVGSDSMKVAINQLTDLNAKFAQAAMARKYVYLNGYWTLSSPDHTRRISPYTASRVTLEGPCEPVKLVSLTINVEKLLKVGQLTGIQLFANYSDGSKTDVTSSATWATDTDAILVGSPPGRIQGAKTGAATLSARYENLTTAAQIQVYNQLTYQPTNKFKSFNGAVGYVATAKDGSEKLYVSGSYTAYDGTTVGKIVRLNLDGTLDVKFGSPSISATSIALYPQADGKILIGSQFGTVMDAASTPYTAYLLRLNADGTLDKSFAARLAGQVSNVAQGPGDTLYVQMPFLTGGGLVRLKSNGALDPSFNVGTGFIGNVFGISVMPDGSDDIMAVGRFKIFNGKLVNNIVRLNSDGSLDQTFNSGLGLSAEANLIVPAIDGSGDVYIKNGTSGFTYNGAVAGPPATASMRVARIRRDGSLDPTFVHPPEIMRSPWEWLNDVKLSQNGKFVFMTGSTMVMNTVNMAIFTDLTGAVAGSFGPFVMKFGSSPYYRLETLKDGSLLAYGTIQVGSQTGIVHFVPSYK